MPVEVKILAYAALLQLVQFLIMGVMVDRQLGIRYTAGPRDELKEITGMAGRMFRALNNHFEALILFSIAVIVVTLNEASSALTQVCAWVYLLARILYLPAYASGIFMLRSSIWFVGLLATMMMIIAALI